MIEAGAKEVPEDRVLEAIMAGHRANVELIAFINTIVDELGQMCIRDSRIVFFIGKVFKCAGKAQHTARAQHRQKAALARNLLCIPEAKPLLIFRGFLLVARFIGDCFFELQIAVYPVFAGAYIIIIAQSKRCV